MGRGMTIYEVQGCMLFCSKAQPDEFGERTVARHDLYSQYLGQFLFFKLLKTRPRGYSFNNPSYLGWMVG
jgi:hypothetical protein